MILIITFLIFALILTIMLPPEIFHKKSSMFSFMRKTENVIQATAAFENKTVDSLIKLSRVIIRLIPVRPNSVYGEKIKRNLIFAGISSKVTIYDFIGLKYFFCLICAVYFLLFYLADATTTKLMLLLAAAVMGYFIPDNWLLGKARRRQSLIEKEVPSILSSLAVTTDAGLNLLQAVEEVALRGKGELAGELKKTLEDIRIGIPQKLAFEKLSERTNVDEVNYFVSALVQALEKGSSGMTAFLREQAKESWSKRKQKAKELAEKASIKLFLPLLLLVFPAFMIFLLGPMCFSIAEILFR
ncbi:MAG: type II secretion system F family protein [Bacillota bacterium]